MPKVISAIIGVLFAIGGSAQAQQIACGEEYVSKDGDTVHSVAALVHKSGLHRQLLVNVLFSKYGDKSGNIPSGTAMEIPCPAGEGFDLPKNYWTSVAYEPARVQVQIGEPQTNMAANDIKGPALFGALLEEAMRESKYRPNYTRLAASDYDASIPFPKSQGAGDLSFPWFGTACAADAVDGVAEDLCDRAFWSDPLFDITSGAYTTGVADGRLDRVPASDLCIAKESLRPVETSGVLNGLTVRTAIKGAADECVQRLRARSVSVVILPDLWAARLNRTATPQNRIVRVSEVVFSDKVHAVVDKANPNARRILQRFNAGVAAMRTSGEWYNIVQLHLTNLSVN